ncbi:hypothetical protein RN001_014422 [Aquatica leii]|uniref:C2H2-type domain-containing protein n=1 Tax=Aquatica leii TaxID=1421715 RepID=A0AAN7P0K5_9COLE|nr:hypothetical protein RN001_014422 [Aquatica leii]
MDGFSHDKLIEPSKQRDGVENIQVVTDKKLKSLFYCTHCGKEYKTLAMLRKHERLFLLAPSEQNEKSCGSCGQTFKYTKRLKSHEFMHEGEEQLWCKHCVKYFPSEEDKELHKMKEHPKRKKKHKCKICPDVIFETEEEYFLHINDTHKGKFGDYHMCSDCGKQFKTKSELTHHNRSKCGTVKQYTCKVCDQKLMTAGSLHNHMLRHTVKCSNMCGFCGKMFLTRGQLKVHERTHTQEKAFVCNVCGKGFCHRQSLITHSTLHTGVKPYQCENCGNAFSCVGNLIKHRRTHADTCGTVPLTSHRVNNPSTKMKVKMNTPLTSKLKTIKKEKEKEDKLIAYKNKLQQKTDTIETSSNTDTKEVEYEFMDAVCENDVSSLADVVQGEEPTSQNKNDETGTIEETKKSESGFEEFLVDRGIVEETFESLCRYCGKTYTNMRWLFRHEKEHEGVHAKISDQFKCACCKMTFPTREECKEHKQRTHADLLSCQDCDKIFSNKDSLRSHCRLFHKGLPKKVYTYVCEKCGVQFRQKAFLNYHKKNNCGSGPIYECHVCGKGFHSIHTRRSHLRIHDPKKKFLCKYCGKSFRWKGQLKVHERSHTGEKPFKCLYCPKAFGYRESLITHSSLHTGIKPHLCQACGSRFSCIGNLIKHRTTHASTCGVWYSKNQ